ncbi:mCG142589, isoform CRA_a [Mus musculus]|nr:mCG142589, isoform CRA_a [Mus musculus]
MAAHRKRQGGRKHLSLPTCFHYGWQVHLLCFSHSFGGV